MAEESILKLHADIAWVLALLWVAKAGRSGEPQPQVHYYLGDRYWQLSEKYKARVRSKGRNASEQELSDTSVQADGTLCRRLPPWLCPFQNDPHSPKPLVGISVHTHQTTLLETWSYGKMLSNPRLKTDAKQAARDG